MILIKILNLFKKILLKIIKSYKNSGLIFKKKFTKRFVVLCTKNIYKIVYFP